MTRFVEGNRLAYYGAHANEKYWSEQWKSLISRHYFRDAEAGRLGWFEKPFTRYLPKKGKILEAGCGTGQYVMALRKRAYDVEGVEWSKKTIRTVKKLYPLIPIRAGNVTTLPVKDEYYSGYISLGVIEHRRQGPEPFLKEAWRVLRPGGIALFSVPHFNIVRRIKALLGLYAAHIPNELSFYQYAYTEDELDEILRRGGFVIVDHYRYDGFKGLKDEIGLFRSLVAPAIAHHTSYPLLVSSNKKNKKEMPRPPVVTFFDYLCGHMTMTICRKI